MLETLYYTNTKKDKSYFFKISVLGILLSSLWCIFIKATPFSDFEYYYNLAVEISQGGAWGDTYTSVGYPIILGGIFKLFGASVRNAQIFNLILTCINYFLVYKILGRLSIEEKTKKIIFTVFVFFPLNIYYSILVGTEILFTNIILWCTYIYLLDFKGKYLILGILTALNTMVKPFYILYAFLIFVVNLVSTGKFIDSFKKAFIIFITSIILLSPWIYRNSKLTGELTWVSNNGGIVLYINNNSQNNHGTWMPAEDVENSIVKTEEYINSNMTKKNKMLSSAAKEWIKSHPKDFIELGLLRLKVTYAAAGDSYYTMYNSVLSDSAKYYIFMFSSAVKALIFYPGILFVLIYSVYILYCIFTKNTRLINKFSLYSLVLFYMITCVYFLTEGQPRYSFPLIFTMTYLSTCFYQKLFYMLKRGFSL
ncbi:glycosyltransferase family 39 protein [Clostridium sp. MSJ-11]|uniref:Glycosyltransferase family 39 protein n=1 Tax=Clostridium mobile TaxID=2841512 RepID=A0ABS6EC82_9CLOT|nr:glycosyltransferase family 39 protein [Clostridium mobile]MBU5482804.1 glycosyltransferase family 39 protein [Clostridium mobile]